MTSTLHELKTLYENRIQALLNRWRDACLSRNWPTTEPETGFEKLPTEHPVYSWWIDTEVAVNRKAHVTVILESETDPNDDGGFVTVANCFSLITLGMKGSDYVKWEAPGISELLGDNEAFEQKFQSLEQVAGGRVVTAIEQHVLNEPGQTI
jgi:hypothetical protein